MILVLFSIWEDARVWAHGNYSLLMHLNYLRSCMVRPFKMVVLLLSEHLLLDQSLLHSHDYPILLIIGLNQ